MRTSTILILCPVLASCYPDRVSSKTYNDLQDEVEALQEQVDSLQDQLDANDAQDAEQDSALQEHDGRLDELEGWRDSWPWGGPDTGGDTGTPCATDADGDGYVAEVCGGDDCDDSDEDVNPEAEEVCDGVDNNCDGDDATMVAAYFDSSDDSISITGSNGYGDGGEGTWTVEAWVYPERLDGAILTFRSGGNADYLEHYFYLSGGLPSVSFSTASEDTSYSSASATTALDTDTWSHVAWVMDAGTIRFYIGGKEAGETTADTVSEKSTTSTGSYKTVGAIGGMSSGSIQPMFGYISDLRTSSDAMYASEFTPSTRLVSLGSTESFWALDDGGSTTTAIDSGSFSNDGTLSGATWGAPPCRP